MARDKVIDIVEAIIDNINIRGGGDHWWGSIDAGARREIRQEWRRIVRAGDAGRLVKGPYAYKVVEAAP